MIYKDEKELNSKRTRKRCGNLYTGINLKSKSKLAKLYSSFSILKRLLFFTGIGCVWFFTSSGTLQTIFVQYLHTLTTINYFLVEPHFQLLRKRQQAMNQVCFQLGIYFTICFSDFNRAQETKHFIGIALIVVHSVQITGNMVCLAVQHMERKKVQQAA